MQHIPLTLARPGMKLAKPITKANGMPVIAAGVELTDAIVDKLRGMGVEKIHVQGAAVAASQNPNERVARLDHLFRRLDTDPFMRKIKIYLREYFTIRGAAEAAKQEQEG